MSLVRSLFEQEKISEALDEYDKKLDACIAQCQVFSFLNTSVSRWFPRFFHPGTD